MGGMDLRAIVLVGLSTVACSDTCSFDSEDKFIARVSEVSVGGPEKTHRSTAGAEGKHNCMEAPESFISLGGGYVIFDLGCQYVTQPGPDFYVSEVAGECGGIDEAYVMSVSADGKVFGFAQEGFGTEVFDVQGIEAFRYVKIQDKLGAGASDSPGADIDALVLLHASP